MSFDDTYSGQTIADVFMFANSTLSLDYASRPRFEWSTQRYSILLSNATGHYSVDLADGLKRASVVGHMSKSAKATKRAVKRRRHKHAARARKH